MCLLVKEHVSSLAHYVTTMHMLAQYIANAYPGLGAMDSCQTETHTHADILHISSWDKYHISSWDKCRTHTHTHTHTHSYRHSHKRTSPSIMVRVPTFCGHLSLHQALVYAEIARLWLNGAVCVSSGVPFLAGALCGAARLFFYLVEH